MDKTKLRLCSNCGFYNQVAEDQGQCRRYPPKIFILNGIYINRWPLVCEDEWCGEHKWATPASEFFEIVKPGETILVPVDK